MSQHEHCRLRLTITNETSSGGHKVSVNSVMVTAQPLLLKVMEMDLQGAFIP